MTSKEDNKPMKTYVIDCEHHYPYYCFNVEAKNKTEERRLAKKKIDPDYEIDNVRELIK